MSILARPARKSTARPFGFGIQREARLPVGPTPDDAAWWASQNTDGYDPADPDARLESWTQSEWSHRFDEHHASELAECGYRAC